jgi:hypothetical protein
MKTGYTFFLAFSVLFCAFISAPAYAQNITPDRFTVYINDIGFSKDAHVRPCYPVMARFHHPDKRVTRIRMQHPDLPQIKYLYFNAQGVSHVYIHENYMRENITSTSEFIAEDENGKRYGKVHLAFVPPKMQDGENLCGGYIG